MLIDCLSKLRGAAVSRHAFSIIKGKRPLQLEWALRQGRAGDLHIATAFVDPWVVHLFILGGIGLENIGFV